MYIVAAARPAPGCCTRWRHMVRGRERTPTNRFGRLTRGVDPQSVSGMDPESVTLLASRRIA
jgi:hypothetical protein